MAIQNIFSNYKCRDQRDRYNQVKCNELLSKKDCFSRDPSVDHFTASTFIVDKTGSMTLLTKHRKLCIWLQLGGHCEGDKNPKKVALKEAKEESGLTSLSFILDNIFDIDIHQIPKNKTDKAHFHYDIRYLLEADISEKLITSDESLDLKWVPIIELNNYTNKESVLVMRDKFINYKSNL